MESHWKWWVVIPPCDREFDPPRAAKTLVACLVQQLPPEELHKLEQVPGNPMRILTNSVDSRWLNAAMVMVYDWCDQHEVWLQWVEPEDVLGSTAVMGAVK